MVHSMPKRGIACAHCAAARSDRESPMPVRSHRGARLSGCRCIPASSASWGNRVGGQLRAVQARRLLRIELDAEIAVGLQRMRQSQAQLLADRVDRRRRTCTAPWRGCQLISARIRRAPRPTRCFLQLLVDGQAGPCNSHPRPGHRHAAALRWYTVYEAGHDHASRAGRSGTRARTGGTRVDRPRANRAVPAFCSSRLPDVLCAPAFTTCTLQRLHEA
jgi:hypothetical protein